ncbi:hypothetical protein LIER_07247 [Lithospermum erythrorhizon]|uniref:Uncharacterized protein n=1 Tax=Lithospermum erythrorhizon TaxID=34254 RepID=A0AAV3P7C5_LITER
MLAPRNPFFYAWHLLSAPSIPSLPPPKRAKYARPSPPASSSSSTRPVTGAFSPKASPDRAINDGLSPFLDQGIMKRMASLGLGPQASHEASRLWVQVTSASRALEDGHTGQAQGLREELARERLKVGALVAWSVGARAPVPPRPSQQLSLGHGLAGPRSDEGPGPYSNTPGSY